MKTTTTGTDFLRRPSDIAGQRRPVPVVRPRRKRPTALAPKHAFIPGRQARGIGGMRWFVRKLLLLVAAVLIVVSIVQKPSILLLCFMPTAMAATAVRLLLGLLAAIAIKACTPSLTWRSRAFLPGGWRTLVAFGLTLGLFALLYNVFGSAPFRKLGAADVVGHKAYVTELVALIFLWLALLR